MANRCSQTVSLFGEPSKIQEVIDYIKSQKVTDFEDGSFYTEIFPRVDCFISCSIEGADHLHLETKWGPASIKDLSKKFPEVGFRSGSFTDGTGTEEEEYVLGGYIIFGQYLDVQGPEWWERVTGNKMTQTVYITDTYVDKSYPGLCETPDDNKLDQNNEYN